MFTIQSIKLSCWYADRCCG